MINKQSAYKFCKDDISKIENYEKAVSDTTQTWVIHHRLELTLDGEFAHSVKELIRLGMYYRRPYFELIFLTHSEHSKLHNKGKNNPMYGKPGTKLGTPAWNKGKHGIYSEETKAKMSAAKKGKLKLAETKLRMSAAKKAYWAKRKQEKLQ